MFPIETVTFLFTDIEGSTKLWEQYPEEMKAALARHDSIMRESIESNRGYIIKTTGNGVHAAFEKAIDEINATSHAQKILNEISLRPSTNTQRYPTTNMKMNFPAANGRGSSFVGIQTKLD